MIPPTLSMIIDSGVTDNGERVVPESNDFCFQAHLSIYNFAKPYAHGKRPGAHRDRRCREHRIRRRWWRARSGGQGLPCGIRS